MVFFLTLAKSPTPVLSPAVPLLFHALSGIADSRLMTCQGCEGGELGRPISAGHLGMYRGLVVR